tara:strand:- start:56 stop:256 length:201 start_codon:yes stop_codon:yes gene_type:complete
MAKKKYYSMNEVPSGTEMIVKSTGEKIILIEVQNFPTTFITENKDKVKKNYMTYEVDIVNWPPEKE